MNNLPDPIGAAWLAQTFDLMPIARLPVVSQIGGRRETQIQEGFRQGIFQESMRPDNTLVAHRQCVGALSPYKSSQRMMDMASIAGMAPTIQVSKPKAAPARRAAHKTPAHA